MTSRASGTFDVRITPQPADEYADGVTMGRNTIDKQFHGALDATSKGQMLSGGDYRTGSAAYVAIERVSGTLDGRRGTFILQHDATMHRGAQHLDIKVVPGSGTAALEGIEWTMAIVIEKGQHSYDFTYTLPARA